MPEKTVLRLFEREVGWEERRIPSTVDRIDETSFIGEFVAHPVCCARADGTRQTFTVHVSSPDDSKFVPLPRLPPLPIVPVSGPKTGKKLQPKKPAFYCAPCHSAGESNLHKACLFDWFSVIMPHPNGQENNQCQPSAQSADVDTHAKRSCDKEGETDSLNIPTAEFVNTLKIAGRISAKARGKELVIAICNKHTGKNFVMHVTFGLEGHCFWIPTQMYRWIVSQEPVPRGETSYAYPIKDEDVDGPATGCKVSIQAAFIRPEYTLIFVDHNSLIQFHVMQMPEHFTADDLRPGSEFWPVLWSQSHGPVYSQEPEATIQALEDWRASILNRLQDLSPIAVCMRANQMAFNGSGTQETSDQLFLALIHPQMPAYYVCRNDNLWDRFLKTVIDYDKDRMDLAAPSARLPAVSGPHPFYMNLDGHTKYLHHVFTYRRFNVLIYQDHLRAAHELGLFLPNAIIQPNGCTELPDGVSPKALVKATLRADRGQKFIKAPNFLITVGKIKCYTPFTAQPGPTWKQAVHYLLSVVGLNAVPDTICLAEL
ncbi:hypothetical protein MSAN_00781600 [Mycena sanguinolenta]|uniref:Uncharacterized protein n=1 Tax=Mycena sanguinolenta TaxID=230812 RepID=A0A8H6Z6W5_9AGAR|nr:hypothetical protein MSAN_00781600 [Mycena sanguinolenta]